MPNRVSLKVLALLFLIPALGFIPTAARAGFELTAPPAPVQMTPSMLPPVQPVGPPAMPRATGKPEMLSPVVIEGSTPSSPTSALPPPITIEGAPAPTVSSLSPPPPVPLPPSSSETVRGFANHVPLAVALREILPSGYGFSVDQDVDLGVLVSFNGGKSWRETLKEALEPAGLVIREQGQMVSIGYPAKSDIAPMPVANEGIMAKPKPAVSDHYMNLPSGTLPPAIVVPTAITGSTPSMPARPAMQSWDAERGDGLRKVIESWAHNANVEVTWMSEYDYPLQASVHFTGTFEEAVRNLLTGFETAHPQPVAELHSNPKAGQTVLLVTTRGNADE